ncbi:MAG: HEAT repeat domain-containing protein [Chloracidobacterium sp.]|nr:HEAT repeat domain-containing protein [Chloracidobacterium sp.]
MSLRSKSESSVRRQSSVLLLSGLLAVTANAQSPLSVATGVAGGTVASGTAVGSPQPAKEETPEERGAALEAARIILAQGLTERNADRRREVVIALSLTRVENDPFPLLETAIADKDMHVQVAACATLAGLRDPRAVPLLRKALNSETPEVAFAAAKALYAHGNADGKQALLDIVAGERRAKSGYFSSQRRALFRSMKTPGGFFRLAFRYGIGFMPVPGLGMGLSSLAGLLADANLSGRAQAIAVLPPVKDAETVAMLREALTDEDWTVRAAAVHALAMSEQTVARRDLVPLFQDPKDAVRYRAAAAYLRLVTAVRARSSSGKLNPARQPTNRARSRS